MFPKRCVCDVCEVWKNVLIWYSSIFCGKVLSDETRLSRPPFSFSSRCFIRMVPLPSCRNMFSHLEVLWKSWSTQWYLLLYSITDITPKNRDCGREMDATTLIYLIKINNIVASSTVSSLPFLECLWWNIIKLYTLVTDYFQSPASWYLLARLSWFFPKGVFYFFSLKLGKNVLRCF